MLPVKPDFVVQPADRIAASKPSAKLHAGASSSPKVQELRARYEALQSAADKLIVMK